MNKIYIRTTIDNIYDFNKENSLTPSGEGES